MIAILNIIWFALLTILLLYIPIALGGVLPNDIFLAELISTLLLILTLFLNTLENKQNTAKIKLRFIYPLIGILLISIIQIVPLPHTFLTIFSPFTIQIKSLSTNIYAYKLINQPHQGNILLSLSPTSQSIYTIAIYPYAHYYKLLWLLSLTMLFFAIFKKNLSKFQIRIMLLLIIISGLIQSMIYLTSYLQGKPLFSNLLNLKLKNIAGTFINRDHFAAYINMILPITASWTSFHIRRINKSAFLSSAKSMSLIKYKNGIIIISIICFILMILALFFSLSRAAIVSSSLAFAFLFYIKGRASGKVSLSKNIIITTLIIFSIVYWIGYLPILQRFKDVPSEFESVAGRFAVWQNTIQLIKDFPILGIGLDNFSYVFNKYKHFSNIHYSYAHNDYLQFTAELGIIALLLLLALIALFYHQILNFPWHNNSRSQLLAFGMLSSITAISLHSFFDFPLQTPANAILFTTYAALVFSFIKINTIERIESIKQKKYYPFLHKN